MTRNKVKDPNHLSFGRLMLWKSLDISAGWVNVIMLNYLNIYASDFLGLDIGLVGVLLFVSKLLDGLVDFFIGWLVDNILRCEWGFDGIVMTDWGSTNANAADPVRCARAGNDLIMPGNPYDHEQLRAAAADGRLAPADLRRAAARVLRLIGNGVTPGWRKETL